MNSENMVIMICVAVLAVLLIKLLFTCMADKYVKINRGKLFDKNGLAASKGRNLGMWLKDNKITYMRYIEILGIDQVYNCSSSVVANASRDMVKYLMKYSSVDASAECLEYVDFCITYMQSLGILQTEMQDLQKNIRSQLPVFVRLFATGKMIPYTVCDVDHDLTKIEDPVFCFSYISPAGKSERSCKIQVTPNILKNVRSEIYAKRTRAGHSRTQRSAMTNDLREAIKKRDNYTCCICGNSVFKEPNLLLEVDHIVPVSKGGKTEASNLQTLCWRCNRRKSDKCSG